MSDSAQLTEGATETFLSFKMGDELFAINVDHVIEMVEVPKVTKVPKAPDYMYGVINLRGQVLPVIDTRIKFGMEPIQLALNTGIIVTELEAAGERIVVGALVDGFMEVFEMNMDQLRPSPSIDPKYNMEFIQGMIPYQEKFIMLLQVSKVFSLEDLQNLNQQKQHNSN